MILYPSLVHHEALLEIEAGRLVPRQANASERMRSMDGIAGFVQRIFAVAALVFLVAEVDEVLNTGAEQVALRKDVNGCANPETVATVGQFANSALNSD